MSDAGRDARVREDFNKIDTDNDGYITVNELREYHKADPAASAEEVDIITRYADSDGDERISYEEIRAVCHVISFPGWLTVKSVVDPLAA